MSFHRKLFGYVPAMEGAEEDTPEPEVQEVTVPEGDEAEATGETDATQDDAAGGEGDAEPTEDDAADEAKAGDDLSLVNVDSLNIEQVAKVEAAQAKIEEGQDAEIETVQDAISESKNLVQAIEALQEMRIGKVTMGPMGFRHSQSFLVSARARLGYPEPSKGIAMEAMSDKRLEISLEGFSQTLRNIIDAIIGWIKKAIAWLKNAIKKFTANVKKAKNDTKILTHALLAQRKAKGIDNKANMQQGVSSYGINDDSNGIPGLALDAMALRRLCIDGSQPSDYDVAFTQVKNEIQTHQRIVGFFNDSFVQYASGLLDIIASEDQLDPNLRAIPVEHLLGTNYQQLDPKHVKSISEERGIPTPDIGYWSGALLGNQAFCQFFGGKPAGVSLLDDLQNLAEWQWLQHSSPDSVFKDVRVRYLSSSEVNAASLTVEMVEQELMDLEKSVELFDRMQEKMIFLIEKANQRLMPMSSTGEFFDSNNEENGWRGPLLVELIRVMRSVMSNAGKAFQGYHSYGLATCVAWNMYLKCIIDAEAKMKYAPK